jgi:hypothetical protein
MEFLTKEQLKERFSKRYELEEDLERMTPDDICLQLSFSDYAGDTVDQAYIGYFEKNYKKQLGKTIFIDSTKYNGENCFVFGELAKKIQEETENYPLGFENVEDFYSEMEYKAYYKTLKDIRKDLRKDYIIKKGSSDRMEDLAREGYIRFHDSFNAPDCDPFIDKLEEEGLIVKRK